MKAGAGGKLHLFNGRPRVPIGPAVTTILRPLPIGFERLAYSTREEVTSRVLLEWKSPSFPEGGGHGSRTEAQSESPGFATEPYRTRAAVLSRSATPVPKR